MDNKGQSAKCPYYRCQYNDWDCIEFEIVGKGEIHFYSMIRLDKMTEECQAPTLQCPLQGDCHLMEVSGVLLKFIVLSWSYILRHSADTWPSCWWVCWQTYWPTLQPHIGWNDCKYLANILIDTWLVTFPVDTRLKLILILILSATHRWHIRPLLYIVRFYSVWCWNMQCYHYGMQSNVWTKNKHGHWPT